jgi:hypothetical protein
VVKSHELLDGDQIVGHVWTAIWLWPATMAFIVILLFAFFFKDQGRTPAAS